MKKKECVICKMILTIFFVYVFCFGNYIMHFNKVDFKITPFNSINITKEKDSIKFIWELSFLETWKLNYVKDEKNKKIIFEYIQDSKNWVKEHKYSIKDIGDYKLCYKNKYFESCDYN